MKLSNTDPTILLFFNKKTPPPTRIKANADS